MHKYLVIGSAPYMPEWISKHLNWFVKNDYRIICFNNSWKLVPPENIYVWFHSNDFKQKNTYIPSIDEIPLESRIDSHGYLDKKLPEFLPHIPDLYKLYIKINGGTMFLNVIYSLLRSHGTNASVVVIGCDMIYTKSGDTFYSHEKESKARNDPLLLWGEAGLAAECINSNEMFQKYGNPIMNASTYQTRLPYLKFVQHLSSVNTTQNVWSVFTIYSKNYTKYFENFKNSIPPNIKFYYSKTVDFDTRKSTEKWFRCLEYVKAHINEYIVLCDTTSIVNKVLNFDILSDIEQCDIMLLRGYHSERSKFNLGCMIVKSNQKIIRFFERVCKVIEQKKQWDQDVVDDLLYHEQYNKSNEDSKYNIVWRYIPDKFAIIVSGKEDSMIDIPKDICLYKFIRQHDFKTYNALLDHSLNS